MPIHTAQGTPLVCDYVSLQASDLYPSAPARRQGNGMARPRRDGEAHLKRCIVYRFYTHPGCIGIAWRVALASPQ